MPCARCDERVSESRGAYEVHSRGTDESLGSRKPLGFTTNITRAAAVTRRGIIRLDAGEKDPVGSDRMSERTDFYFLDFYRYVARRPLLQKRTTNAFNRSHRVHDVIAADHGAQRSSMLRINLSR